MSSVFLGRCLFMAIHYYTAVLPSFLSRICIARFAQLSGLVCHTGRLAVAIGQVSREYPNLGCGLMSRFVILRLAERLKCSAYEYEVAVTAGTTLVLAYVRGGHVPLLVKANKALHLTVHTMRASQYGKGRRSRYGVGNSPVVDKPRLWRAVGLSGVNQPLPTRRIRYLPPKDVKISISLWHKSARTMMTQKSQARALASGQYITKRLDDGNILVVPNVSKRYTNKD